MTVLPLRSVSVDSAVFVNEKFVSFQGEGPLAGQRCAFVRFSHCNLACSWCDTEESWNFAKYDRKQVSSRIAVSGLAAWVAGQNVDLLVITGGEPMVQQGAMVSLVSSVPGWVRVQVETNGTRVPLPELVERVDLWVVSPKLANSQMAYGDRIKPDALAALRATGRAAFKFVVTDAGRDFEEIASLVEELSLAPVWVMPEGTTEDAVLEGLRRVCGPALKRGWNVSSRLHILTGIR